MKVILDGDVVVDPDVAKERWPGVRGTLDGCVVDTNTGSAIRTQTLYVTNDDVYYVVTTSFMEGEGTWGKIVTDVEAATWLLRNGYLLPHELSSLR